MSDWSESEKKALVNDLVKNAALGANGAIHRTLLLILEAVEDGKESTTAFEKELKNSLKKNGKSGENPVSDSGGQSGDTSRSQAEKDLEKKYNSGLNKVIGKLNIFSDKLSSVAGFMIGGAAGVGLYNVLRESAVAYTSLYSSGMMFDGSLLQLNKSAAIAGVNLREFTDIMQGNADVVARLGGPDAFGGLIRESRGAMISVGMLGMSTGDIAENLGEYQRTLSLLGPIDENSRKGSIASFQNLMQETTALSSVTGRSRRDMLKNINDAAKNTIAVSKLMTLPAAQAKKAQDNMKMVNTMLSGFGDASGSFFTQALAEGMNDGGLALTSFGEDLTQAGLGNLIPAMDKLSKKVQNGAATEEDSISVLQTFMGSVGSNIDMLRMQAVAGNSAAKAALDMYTEINSSGKSLSELTKEMDKNKKQQKQLEPLTQLFQTLGQSISLVVSGFKSGFMISIEKIFGSMGNGGFANFLKTFPEKVEKMATALGGKLGDIVMAFFPNQDAGQILDNVLTGLSSVAESALYLGTGLVWVMTKIVSIVEGIRTVMTGITGIFTGNDQVANGIGSGLTAMFVLLAPKILGGITGGIVKLFTLGAGKLMGGLFGKIAGLFGGGDAAVGGGLFAGIGNFFKGIFGILGAAGKGAGELIKGLFTGLGSGLQALGNPKTLLGVLALGGMAGTLWVTGQALQSFMGLSWESLGMAGAAIGGIALAIAGLGALMMTGVGAMVAGAGLIALVGIAGAMAIIGHAGGVFADGISKIAPALDILQNTVDGTKLSDVGKAMTEVGKAFLPFAAGGALFNAFGGEGGFTSLVNGIQQFEKLDPNKLIAVAQAMGQIKENMPSVTDTIGAKISGWFSSDDSSSANKNSLETGVGITSSIQTQTSQGKTMQEFNESLLNMQAKLVALSEENTRLLNTIARGIINLPDAIN